MYLYFVHLRICAIVYLCICAFVFSKGKGAGFQISSPKLKPNFLPNNPFGNLEEKRALSCRSNSLLKSFCINFPKIFLPWTKKEEMGWFKICPFLTLSEYSMLFQIHTNRKKKRIFLLKNISCNKFDYQLVFAGF